MQAVYEIRTCCGDVVETLEIELPDFCTDPTDNEALNEALNKSGQSDGVRCNRCGDLQYRAHYIGYSVYLPGVADSVDIRADVISATETNSRAHLVTALEAILTFLRAAPDYIDNVTCVDGRIILR